MPRPPTPLDWGPATREQTLLRERADCHARIAEIDRALADLAPPPALPTPLPPADEWLSPKAAAARTGWSAETIRRWARTGRIRALESGGYKRVSWADLLAMEKR